MSTIVTLKLSPKEYKIIVLATRTLLRIARHVGQEPEYARTPQEFVCHLFREIRVELDPFSNSVDVATLKRQLANVLRELGAT